MEVISGLALAVPAGLNAYIPLLAVSLAQRFGWLELRAPFDIMGEWWVIALIGVLLAIEVIADKVPAVDHANDVVQSIVRPAAGGIAAVAASGDAQVSSALMIVLGILLAGTTHAAKAAARPVVNATTVGVATPAVSTAEDVGAAGLSALAIFTPLIAMLLILIAFALLAVSIYMWRRDRRAPSV